MQKLVFFFFITMMFVFNFGTLSFAQNLNQQQSVQLSSAVKEKMYLGGADEEELRVQKELPPIHRKQTPRVTQIQEQQEISED